MSRLRWPAAMVWFAASAAAFAWSLIPARTETRRIALEPVDFRQITPTLGTHPAPDSDSATAARMPTLDLQEMLPSRLRLGAEERVRLIVSAPPGSSDRPSLLATATLHADGTEAEPAGEISLPLTDADPVHFDWRIIARQPGPTWLSLSLHLRFVSADGTLLDERLVWADSTLRTAQSWLGLPAPIARAGGLASSLVAAAVMWRMAREGRP